jgi:DNA polymerase III delta subunit
MELWREFGKEAHRYYFDQISIDEVVEMVKGGSLLGGEVKVALLHTQFSKEVERLNRIKPVGRVYLFQLEEKSIPNLEVKVRLFPPTYRQLVQFVEREGKKIGLNLSPEIVRWLVEMVDPLLLRSELEKVAHLTPNPKLEELEELIVPSRLEGLGEIWSKIVNGQLPLSHLKKLTHLYSPPQLLASFIHNQKEIIKVYLFMEKTGRGDLSQLYGYKPPPSVEERLKRDALLFPLSRHRQIFETLLEGQLELRRELPDPIYSPFWATILKVVNLVSEGKLKK